LKIFVMTGIILYIVKGVYKNEKKYQ